MSGARKPPFRVLWRSAALDARSALGPSARLAAAVLAEYSTDDEGRLRHPPSAATLADRMRCSERTAGDARRELVAEGFLELDRYSRREAPATRLLLPSHAKSAGLSPAKSAGLSPEASPEASPARSADGSRGSRGSRGTAKTSSGGAASAATQGVERALGREGEAGRLVAGFVRNLRDLGATPTDRVVGQVARNVGELLRDGVAPETVAAALDRLIERRLNPSTLPSLALEMELGPKGSTSADAELERLQAYDR